MKSGTALALGLAPLSLAIGFCASGLVTLALAEFVPQIFTGFRPVSPASQDSLVGGAICFLVLGSIFSLIAGRVCGLYGNGRSGEDEARRLVARAEKLTRR